LSVAEYIPESYHDTVKKVLIVDTATEVAPTGTLTSEGAFGGKELEN
jgi:hypothetical protein